MKNQNTISTFLVSTSQQKVLKFLCENLDKEFYDAQIAREIDGISKASVNNALRELHATNIITRRYLGNIALNSIALSNPVIRQYKILLTISTLSTLIDKLNTDCQEIILFGSSVLGENKIDDPIDLFIVTDSIRTVEKLIENDPLSKRLHLIIHTPRQVEMFQKEAPVFFESINKGIKLL